MTYTELESIERDEYRHEYERKAATTVLRMLDRNEIDECNHAEISRQYHNECAFN